MPKKITVFSSDPGNHKFVIPLMDKLVDYGYSYNIRNGWTEYDADIYWFDFCDNNLIVASTEDREKLRGKKIIARLHSVEYYMGYHRTIDWTAVDDLIFVSDHMRDKVGEVDTRTHVIHNGIDLDKYTYRERKHGTKIAYAGNIVPNKGTLIMFHYFRQLLNKDDRFQLHLVGLNRFHGRDGEYYQHYLKETGLDKFVFESGEVPDVNGWLDDKDYLWQPSLAESFSMIVGEAMAKGIMPLVNNFSGARSLWPNVYSDFDQFYKIIKGPYESLKYREYVSRYSLDDAVYKTLEVLNL